MLKLIIEKAILLLLQVTIGQTIKSKEEVSSNRWYTRRKVSQIQLLHNKMLRVISKIKIKKNPKTTLRMPKANAANPIENSNSKMPGSNHSIGSKGLSPKNKKKKVKTIKRVVINNQWRDQLEIKGKWYIDLREHLRKKKEIKIKKTLQITLMISNRKVLESLELSLKSKINNQSIE